MTMIISVCMPLHDTMCVLVTYDNDNLIQVNECFYGVGEKLLTSVCTPLHDTEVALWSMV